MIVYTEMNLCSFVFWSGAKNNAQMLTNEEIEMVGDIIEDIYNEGINETQLNDLFWFDFSLVCEWLGYYYDEENNVVIREINKEIEEE